MTQSTIARSVFRSIQGLCAVSLLLAGCGSSSSGVVGTGGNAAGTGGATGVAGRTGTAGTTGAGGATGAAGMVGAGGSGSGGAAGATATGGASGMGGSTGNGGACPAGGWVPGPDQTIMLTWGGVNRQYVVHVPAGYTGTTRVPLMLVIHGAHNTPALVRGWSQMNPVSDQNGFIIAYPAGLDCWNAGGILPGCTAAADDVGFLKAVVGDVESHACIDQKRVYATGISNGSIMAQYMGCQAADIFAAVGGVSGGVGRCSPSRPLSVFYVHGTADTTVPYSAAQPNVTGWANRDGCTGSPVQTYSMGSTTCVTYETCTAGVQVEFCTVTGMGHCWPEDTRCGPQPGFGVTDFKASPMMWDFFSRHPLP